MSKNKEREWADRAVVFLQAVEDDDTDMTAWDYVSSARKLIGQYENIMVERKGRDKQEQEDPKVMCLPCVPGKKEGPRCFEVHKSLLDALEDAYPAVDGMATLKEIRVWCMTNTTKLKTHRGVPRFIHSWFSREQNKPAGVR